MSHNGEVEQRKKVAFLTMDGLDDFCCYDTLTKEPLSTLGYDVDDVSWRRDNVDWKQYAMVVVRSPWDYQKDPKSFMDRLKEIQSITRLENRIDMMTWNMHKTYLRDLHEKHGVPIVPTVWHKAEVGDPIETIKEAFRKFEVEEVVVKPVIGANADDTFRFRQDQLPSNDQPASDLVQRVRDVFSVKDAMIQPFVTSITSLGEYSLFYFNGEYSHTILKTPKEGDFRVQEEHGGLIQRVHSPPNDILSTGQSVVSALPTLLYARVDLVRIAPDSHPALIELELIEPSLYFNFDPESPLRFAKALHKCL